jgi:outer membrane protein assembly factor BamE
MIVFHRHRTRSIGAAVLFAFALGACQKVPMLPGLSAHRIDIQQGNVVTQEMVAKLKPGMTRQQVRFVLGTPPIVDPFHPQRWDYVYYYRKAGTVTEHRRLVLLFDGDTLKRIEGDVIPAAEGGGSVVDGEPGGSPGSAGVKPTK